MSNNIEQIEITHQANGKKKKVQASWLLSSGADWYMDAQPFLITDSKIGEKLHGEFSGKPVKVRMLAKYPYLKSRLEDYEEETREEDSTAPIGNDEPTETTETETTNQGGVDEVPSLVEGGLVGDNISLEEKIGAFMNVDDMNADELVGYLILKEIKFDKRKKKNIEYLRELANK